MVSGIAISIGCTDPPTLPPPHALCRNRMHWVKIVGKVTKNFHASNYGLKLISSTRKLGQGVPAPNNTMSAVTIN